jgi:hypothetical protein
MIKNKVIQITATGNGDSEDIVYALTSEGEILKENDGAWFVMTPDLTNFELIGFSGYPSEKKYLTRRFKPLSSQKNSKTPVEARA